MFGGERSSGERGGRATRGSQTTCSLKETFPPQGRCAHAFASAGNAKGSGALGALASERERAQGYARQRNQALDTASVRAKRVRFLIPLTGLMGEVLLRRSRAWAEFPGIRCQALRGCSKFSPAGAQA